jgi:hypothetical protein
MVATAATQEPVDYRSTLQWISDDRRAHHPLVTMR